MSKDYKMEIKQGTELVEYDASIIQKFAQKLYSKADSIEALYLIMGLIVGALAAVVFSASAQNGAADLAALVGAIVGAIIGRMMGSSRAIQYRIEAQKALCFAQIEKNTRPQ